MDIDGNSAVKEVTGGYPVYPGHPLTVAWQIMSVFQTPSEALKNAIADNRINGGGGEVHLACDLLLMASKGATFEELVIWADERWIGGQAGGHIKAIEPGIAQAEKIKPHFAQKLAQWLGQEDASESSAVETAKS